MDVKFEIKYHLEKHPVFKKHMTKIEKIQNIVGLIFFGSAVLFALSIVLSELLNIHLLLYFSAASFFGSVFVGLGVSLYDVKKSIINKTLNALNINQTIQGIEQMTDEQVHEFIGQYDEFKDFRKASNEDIQAMHDRIKNSGLDVLFKDWVRYVKFVDASTSNLYINEKSLALWEQRLHDGLHPPIPQETFLGQMIKNDEVVNEDENLDEIMIASPIKKMSVC